MVVISCETTSTSGVSYYMLGLKVDPANRPFGYRVYSDGVLKATFTGANPRFGSLPANIPSK